MTELLHPLWSPGTEPLKIGDSLFRGTSSKFVRHDKLLSHEGERIYFSEGDEDAEGYACIVAEDHGGEPILIEVELTEELVKLLKPGMEGLGEWYIETKELPIPIKKLHHAKCLARDD